MFVSHTEHCLADRRQDMLIGHIMELKIKVRMAANPGANHKRRNLLLRSKNYATEGMSDSRPTDHVETREWFRSFICGGEKRLADRCGHRIQLRFHKYAFNTTRKRQCSVQRQILHTRYTVTRTNT